MEWTQSFPIFLLVITETFLWFSFVGLLIGLPKPKRIYRSAGKWIDGACGANIWSIRRRSNLQRFKRITSSLKLLESKGC